MSQEMRGMPRKKCLYPHRARRGCRQRALILWPRIRWRLPVLLAAWPTGLRLLAVARKPEPGSIGGKARRREEEILRLCATLVWPPALQRRQYGVPLILYASPLGALQAKMLCQLGGQRAAVIQVARAPAAAGPGAVAGLAPRIPLRPGFGFFRHSPTLPHLARPIWPGLTEVAKIPPASFGEPNRES